MYVITAYTEYKYVYEIANQIIICPPRLAPARIDRL